MPFTPSHAVVALAFSNKRIPAAAVAIGAMVPDVGLSLPLGAAQESTHSLLGIVTVDLLLGLLALVLWSSFVAPAWRDLAPARVRSRFHPWCPPPSGMFARMRLAVLAAVGVVIGAASHVLWDGFTHRGGLFVSAVPMLRQQLGPFVGYKWVECGSGMIGLLGLGIGATAWYVGRRPRPLEPDGRQSARIAAGAVVLAAAVVPAGIMLAGADVDPFGSACRVVLARAVVLSLSGAGAAVVVVAALWRLTVRPLSA
ncbi:DUF4184 family protein [Rathayibacter iranicus]|uniref:DUF4184 family protein n=2 Tax=Rathayibacter iranicus TaxID=59737 RepID=A0AAD1AEN1_9MICO|nr:DUF4184 family protein [Rathayibacter iranicus]AZZ56823.1 hypothetical protein C7V51_13775 [Rathayibacter iranicus]MWV32007.1 DUF4184 family protein [Rathayibacter iranicus NCPPB 2253 = VKM Ac-1602]PPI42578.1 hypothetical protein C5E09_12620 [Rathayibacter iranicus]PPI68954.1 hypothetical protein C5E01_12580 [Rathayibacter iranicus]PWJ62033.1 uncharacterized protein DUF4184 [Rathayibacter iranicus NCPPB 2253 = VKM Ac-1602]